MTEEQQRQTIIEELFQQHYEDLRSVAAESNKLLVTDLDNILQALACRLNEYQGDPESTPFLEWAASVIRPAAQRISKFYEILEQHSGVIRGGIWAALPKSNRFDDNSALVQEAFQEVAMLVLANLDALLEPGRAKLSTRLFALAKRHTLDYHVKKARRRLRAVQRRLSLGDFKLPEIISAKELASMRFDEAEEIMT